MVTKVVLNVKWGVAIAISESAGIAISVDHKDMSVKELDFPTPKCLL